MSQNDKPIVWLRGKVKSPPFSAAARIEAGYLLRKLQQGESLEMPHSRPMPSIGAHCHELRITDKTVVWRLIYRIDNDAIVMVEVFKKITQQTPKTILEACKIRLKDYDDA